MTGSTVTGVVSGCGVKAANASGATARTSVEHASGVHARWQLAVVAAQPPKGMAIGPIITQAASSTRLKTRRQLMALPV